MIDFDVRHYDSVGSTNDEALRLAREGAAHGVVVCAREQVTGRGRQGRQWHSPAGNLYLSMLLRPDVPPAHAATLSFVSALAVADTVDAFLSGGMRAALKWPNDVLVGGAKIAGILIEYADTAVVIGIGVNVAHAPEGTPYPVTCLRTPSPTLPRFAGEGWGGGAPNTVLPTLLTAFASRYTEWRDSRFATTRTAWLARAHPPGSPLRITVGARSILGRFADLAPDGALVIETADGLARIVAGEVSAHLALTYPHVDRSGGTGREL